MGEGGVLSCAMRRAVRTLSLEHGNQDVHRFSIDFPSFFHGKTIQNVSIPRHRAPKSMVSLQEFSILDTFKRCKVFAKRLTREQHVTLQYNGTHPSQVAWPLGFPWWEYMRKARLMRVDIQELAEDGLDSDDYLQPLPRASPVAPGHRSPNFGQIM